MLPSEPWSLPAREVRHGDRDVVLHLGVCDVPVRCRGPDFFTAGADLQDVSEGSSKDDPVGLFMQTAMRFPKLVRYCARD